MKFKTSPKIIKYGNSNPGPSYYDPKYEISVK